MNKEPLAGIVGPYRYHNFGDDLIGLVIARYLALTGYKRVLMHDVLDENISYANVDKRSIGEIVRTVHLLVLGGGHILGDGGYSPNNFYQKLLAKSAFLRAIRRQKTVIAGVGAGPLRLTSARFYSQIACHLVSSIGVRDSVSFEFVRSTLLRGRTDKLVEGADLALLWPEVLPITLPERGEHRVGIQLDPKHIPWPEWLNPLLSRFALQNRSIAYLSNGAFPSAAAKFITLPGSHLCYSNMKDFLSGLADCSFVITTHLHIAIASYAARIPSISISINDKTLRFYEQIGHPERCISLKTATPESVSALLMRAEHICWTPTDESRLSILKAKAQSMLTTVLSKE